jgi:hypothetical protein
MRPLLPPEKKRKMVSFMISPECASVIENMIKEYQTKIFRRFTKTDLFEMGIWHLSQDLAKKSITDLYKKYLKDKS